jgi:glycosyltransferase involved in cell wall biosynthesis
MGYKILLIHTRYRLSGGEDRVLENEANLLAERGHNIEILTFDNTNYSNVKFLFFLFNIFSYFRVYYKIKKCKPDIVHVHNFFFAASPSILYAIKLFKLPLILTTHNFRFICPSAVLSLKGKLYEYSLNKSFPWKAIRDNAYKNSLLASLWVSSIYWFHNKIGTWKLIDTLIIPNPYASFLYASQKSLLLNNDLVSKANFITDPGFSNVKRSEDFVFIGRLSEEKGIQMMLTAFEGSSKSFHIYGEGPLLDDVLTACKLNKNIHYWGFIPKEEVLRILSSCAAIIIPSVCMEMTSLILIEALACGTPVVVSKIKTFEEYIISMKTGLLFEQDNAQSLIKALDTFACLPETLKVSMGHNCRNLYLESFTPDNTYKVLMDVYKRNIECATK